MSAVRLAIVVMIASVLAACNQPHVQTVQSYLGPPLPRPDHILVSYFSVTPDQVRLDQGIGARISRAADDQPPDAHEMQAALATQAALARQLVQRLGSYGLPAQLATEPPPPGSSVLVQGQIVGIDQGNRARRVLIGLGAGKSTVSADTQLFFATGFEPPRFLNAFQGAADSGHAPGAAETLGAGAVGNHLATSTVLTGGMHGSAEMRKTSDTSEAGRLADGLAKQIGQFAATQGWIPIAVVE